MFKLFPKSDTPWKWIINYTIGWRTTWNSKEPNFPEINFQSFVKGRRNKSGEGKSWWKEQPNKCRGWLLLTEKFDALSWNKRKGLLHDVRFMQKTLKCYPSFFCGFFLHPSVYFLRFLSTIFFLFISVCLSLNLSVHN